MTSIILAAILVLMPAPSPKWGETPTEYRARAELIAQAIETASSVARPAQRQRMAMAVAVTFWGEGRFAPLVQSGERLGDGGQAICLGGLHPGKLSHAEWLALGGLDLESTTRCATETAKRLKLSWYYCDEQDGRHSWTEALVLYGTGRTCHAEESKWKNIFLDRGDKWAKLTAS